MASELSLTWDEHQSTLVGVFEKLLTAGALVDCTIAAEGQYLKAHKIILSACSPYFEMLFTEEKEKNPIVVLKDIKFQELKAMIDFIYRGKVKVPEERLGDFVDAAESLQIKGLGVSNKNINSPEQSANESSAVMRKKEGRVSPLPRKRSRRSYANNNGDNVRGISPVVDINIEGAEELRSQMDVPSSSQSDPSPPLVSARDSPSVLPSSECGDQRNVDTSDTLPFDESASEELPNPETVVVKSEPEPMAEVFIPEIECFIEPKSEEVVLQETMLDCGSGEIEPAAGDSQHSSSQYSAFSTALQGSSSSTGRSDNLLLMTDVVDSFNTQGAVRGGQVQQHTSPAAVDRAPQASSVADGSSDASRPCFMFIIPQAVQPVKPAQKRTGAALPRIAPKIPLKAVPRIAPKIILNAALHTSTTHDSRNESTNLADPLMLTLGDLMKRFEKNTGNVVDTMTSRPPGHESVPPRTANNSVALVHALSDSSDRNRGTEDVLGSADLNSIIIQDVHSLSTSNGSKVLPVQHPVTTPILKAQKLSRASDDLPNVNHRDPTTDSTNDSKIIQDTKKLTFQDNETATSLSFDKSSNSHRDAGESFSPAHNISSSSSMGIGNTKMHNVPSASNVPDRHETQTSASFPNTETVQRLLNLAHLDYAGGDINTQKNTGGPKKTTHTLNAPSCSPRILKSVSCPECDRIFPSPIQLKRHFRTHTNPSDPLAQVVMLGRSQKKNRNLRCEICGAKYVRKSLLEKHISKYHGSPPTTPSDR